MADGKRERERERERERKERDRGRETKRKEREKEGEREGERDVSGFSPTGTIGLVACVSTAGTAPVGPLSGPFLGNIFLENIFLTRGYTDTAKGKMHMELTCSGYYH